MISLHESDFPAFRFDLRNGFVGFADHGLENEHGRFHAGVLAIFQRWENREIDIVLKVHLLRDSSIWDFIFRAVQDKRIVELNGDGQADALNFSHCGSACDEHDKGMFAQIAQVIEREKQVIPALVRLESAKQRLDFRRAILGDAFDSVSKLGRVARKGKDAKFQVGVVGTKVCTGPRGMIETRSGVLDDLGRQNSPAEGKPLRQPDFVNFVDAVRIVINNSSVWLFTEKTIDLGFKVLEMFLCPCDSQPRAIEGIVVHGGKIRPNERP
jgi:hypothetical protein